MLLFIVLLGLFILGLSTIIIQYYIMKYRHIR
jgi:hypothetical protein